MEKFICVVVGSRSFENYQILKENLDKLLSNQVNREVIIVSGGAKGTDTMAKRYAMEKNYQYKEYKPDYEKYGRKATYMRNDEMQKFASGFEKRGCVAFWDGESKGTKMSINIAKHYQNQTKIIKV